MRYRVLRYYKAGPVEYQAGQVITIDDAEYAAWLGRDMNGRLEPVVDAPPVVEQVVEPVAVPVVEPAPPVTKARTRKGKRA